MMQAGDNLVSSPYLYGGTWNQLKAQFPRLGITTKFAVDDTAEEFEKLIDEKTKAIYLESMGNPRYNVPDFEKVAAVANKQEKACEY